MFRPHELLLIEAYSHSLVMKAAVTLEDGIERIKNDAGGMQRSRADVMW